jgi:hypothetical protein
MFLLGVVGLAVAWVVILLVWACWAVSKEGDEAFEELNESIRKLQQVASSVARTSGRSAELVRLRAEPIRNILQEMGEGITERR